MLIYICQDGIQPSGVATYGYHFLKNYPQAQMILLNASIPPPAAPAELHSRILLVPEDESHSAENIKDTLLRLTANTTEGITIFPNTGDTPWAAVAAFLRAADPQLRQRVRILGFIHSDMETQYSLADFYLPISPIWIGVSGRCAEIVGKRISPRGGKAHKLFCPVAVPEKLPSRPEGVLQISYVGRLEEPQKKVSRLAPLFKELVERKVDFHAVVAGDGPAAVDFKKSLTDAGAEVIKRVEVPGALTSSQINHLWKTTDIFILTSSYEGLPLGLLEAMAHACCPVVMAVDSGLPELVEDQKNSRVVAQGDISAMAQAIAELNADRAHLKKLALQARADVTERFSIKNHFSTLNQIIADLWKTPVGRVEDLKPEPTEQAVEKLTEKIKSHGRPAVIYGTGMFGRKVVDACLQKGISVCGLVDSNPAKKGKLYRGIACTDAAGIPNFSHAVFAVGSLSFSDEISKRITNAFAANKTPAPPIVSVSL